MAQAIRNWFAYNKAIWLRRKFVVLLQAGKKSADMRPCPTCGKPAIVLVSRFQAVLLCSKCEATFVRKRGVKTPTEPVEEAPVEEAPASDLPECLCCDRQVETKRHKYCAVHKGWSATRKAEAIAIKENPDCK
jgi:hypothetical protein